MAIIKDLLQRIKIHYQIKKNVKSNGINLRQLKKQLKEYQNRELDINEILSRDYSDNSVIDAYEYCMRKCNWDPSTLPDSNVRDFLLCMLYQGEVDNGGVSQFLSNSSGDMSVETVEALKKIDDNAAEILVKALSCFPDGIVPKDREARNNLLDHLDEEKQKCLDELDQVAYGHDGLSAYYNFIHLHQDEFMKF